MSRDHEPGIPASPIGVTTHWYNSLFAWKAVSSRSWLEQHLMIARH